MLDKSIRDRREELKLESIRLSDLLMYEFDFNEKIFQQQDAIYKKWLFYDKFIKAMEKEK